MGETLATRKQCWDRIKSDILFFVNRGVFVRSLLKGNYRKKCFSIPGQVVIK